jgi:uncharacterized damage-inducible protein DinB
VTDTLHRLVAWEAEASGAVVQAARAAAHLPARTWRIAGHLSATPLVWLARATGQPEPDVWPPTTPADADRCLERIAQAEAGWRAYLNATPAEALTAAVTYRSTSGAEHRTAPLDVLLHVATHGAYHRGQINAALRAAGGEPVRQDYIYRVR